MSRDEQDWATWNLMQWFVRNKQKKKHLQ